MGQHECFNKGCQSGNSFYMDEKQEEWYMEKFGSYPKSCPECRSWKKAQVDFRYNCQACFSKRVVPKAKIIGYHKFIGVWQQPTLCRLCKDDPDRETRKRLNRAAQEMLDRHYYGSSDHPRAYLLDNSRGQWLGRKGKRKLEHAREYIHAWMKAGQLTQQQGVEALSRNSLQEVSDFWGVTDLNVPKDPNFYKALPDTSKRHLPNRYEHIMGHYETTVNSRGEIDKGFRETLGARSEQDALYKLHEIAASTDTSRVVDFRDVQQGYLIKYDLQQETVVIIHDQAMKGSNAPPPPPPYIVTAYAPKASAVARKMNGVSGSWVPNIKK